MAKSNAGGARDHGSEFSVALENLRLRKGATYRQIALAVDISHNTLHGWCKGKSVPPPDPGGERRLPRKLAQLLDYLEVKDPRPWLERWEKAFRAKSALATTTGRSATKPRRPAGVPRPTSVPRPRQLPLDVHGFAGRSSELDQLNALLEGLAGPPPATLVTAIGGAAGVGKTTLAVHWAHSIADRFPDGQLYVDLRGFDQSGQASDPGDVLHGFLASFGEEPDRLPPDLDAKAARYRSLLTGRRVLVLLDNARDAAQVRPLLPGSPGCLVVVTSRNDLTGLIAKDGAHLLSLDLLTPLEATQLLENRLGSDRIAAEPEATADLIGLCARLPLALVLVAARAVSRAVSLRALVSELREARTGLDAFTSTDVDTDVPAVFSWSYEQLGPEPARLFRLLGLHPGPDISSAAAASLSGIPSQRVRSVLAELTRVQLISEYTPGRYAAHDLLRAYAAELARSDEPAAERRAALHRVLDHYLHTAHEASRVLYPHGSPLTLADPEPGVTPQRIVEEQVQVSEEESQKQAMDWFTAERPVLVAAVDAAVDAGFDTHTWQLTWTLAEFFARRARYHDRAATLERALAAVRRLADRTEEAHTHRRLARSYDQLGRQTDGMRHRQEALRLYRELGDRAGQANVHLDLAGTLESQSPQAALQHAQQALELFPDRPGRARALNAVGWCYARLGDERALDICRQAVALIRELGNRYGEAAATDTLGYAHHQLGQYALAVVCYREALQLYQELQDQAMEADTLSHLGDTHQAAGETDAARRSWQQALDILDELEHPKAEQVRSKLQGLERPDPLPA